MKTTIIFSKKLWLWLAASLAIIVAGMLVIYPIGMKSADIIFLIAGICMIAGIAVMMAIKNFGGYCLWLSASMIAVVMTVVKCGTEGHASALYIAFMILDIAMPVIGYKFMDFVKVDFDDEEEQDDSKS
jgi:hypothetical protein